MIYPAVRPSEDVAELGPGCDVRCGEPVRDDASDWVGSGSWSVFGAIGRWVRHLGLPQSRGHTRERGILEAASRTENLGALHFSMSRDGCGEDEVGDELVKDGLSLQAFPSDTTMKIYLYCAHHCHDFGIPPVLHDVAD